ncbi:type IV toxin-antitoxin system AbiEi family antitoxin domain-containing protein [Companilactobacillus farciminis]|uniref:type IV toxin-antitoxin system AbiEi family antitoxin domain-containing protein n=1 Tax=Companilactobacillus farciminis TaxID=1612 RepID=UPI0023305A09|nr:hypothetical protein [Companilactobacillus farciminis]WCG35291.1 hypothetical protein PML84_10770 [Companilactobacillus farciminis]
MKIIKNKRLNKLFQEYQSKQLEELATINSKLEQDNILLVSDINEYQSLYVQSLIKSNFLEYASNDILINSDWIPNDFLLRQMILGQGIYSGPTALYLWGLSDEFPYYIYMTFKMGYRLPKTYAKWTENVFTRQINRKNLQNFVNEISVRGTHNKIKLYSKERTLVEILREPYSLDINLVNTAYRRYLKSVNNDTNVLLKTAKSMGNFQRVLTRLELIL